eukprot:TRINITY_DN18781_c0_g2_i1.p1 TRINITY_DN18781_c0_g2~~TRINITY_DN18781_c0_g2_i1.p1  ORF type:complete len:182 (+),score=49.51 TRINITY_DN18781_c0_g2_i1:58-603(+)
MRKLGLGFTLSEIDQLLSVCDYDNSGYIEWRKFLTKLNPRDIDKRIVTRSKNRLEKIRENVYTFFISPKDAFRIFNEDRTGKLNFEQFNKFIVKMSQISHEELPSYAIIKDLFDFFDIRKDGLIDMTEWIQTFKLIEEDPNIDVNIKGKLLRTRDLQVTPSPKPKTEWMRSPEYELSLIHI